MALPLPRYWTILFINRCDAVSTMDACKRNIGVILPVVFLCGALILFMSAEQCNDNGCSVLRGRQSITTNDTTDSAIQRSRRRYSTSDEMLYILYGIGDQFYANDQQLIDYIRSQISQPSLTRPRQLERPRTRHASQVGQSAFVDKLLSGRRNGFFIECGAADGEMFSNSLFFELHRNWTGLLIEANPYYHRALLEKNRRAYVLRGCVCIERRPMVLRLLRDGLYSGIDTSQQSRLSSVKNTTNSYVDVNCFPLNAITSALGVSHVDYLSLDVEGPELEILRTVDWTRLYIDVITVEYKILMGRHIRVDKSASLKKLNDLRQFFDDTGIYREVAVLPSGSEALGLDVVFSRIEQPLRPSLQ